MTDGGRSQHERSARCLDARRRAADGRSPINSTSDFLIRLTPPHGVAQNANDPNAWLHERLDASSSSNNANGFDQSHFTVSNGFDQHAQPQQPTFYSNYHPDPISQHQQLPPRPQLNGQSSSYNGASGSYSLSTDPVVANGNGAGWRSLENNQSYLMQNYSTSDRSEVSESDSVLHAIPAATTAAADHRGISIWPISVPTGRRPTPYLSTSSIVYTILVY